MVLDSSTSGIAVNSFGAFIDRGEYNKESHIEKRSNQADVVFTHVGNCVGVETFQGHGLNGADK